MKLNTHYRITLLFTFITAIVLSVGYVYLIKNLKIYTDQNISEDLRKKTALAKYLLENLPAQKNAASALDEIADHIGQDLHLRATIIDLTGRVLGDSELDGKALQEMENHIKRPEVQDALRTVYGERTRFSTTINKNMLYVAMPYGKPQQEGFIRLALPLSEIQLISAKIKKMIAISLFVIFIFAIMISHFASGLISKPIQEMAKAAKRIAEGDFSKINTLSLDGEIADLSTAFNTMSQQLATRLKEKDLNHSRLEAVLLSMFEGVLVVDSSGSILLINQAFRNFFHINQDAFGKNAIEVIRNLEIAEIIDCAVNSQCPLEACEISIISPEEKVLSVYGTPILRNNRSEGAVLVFHDMTNVRRLEKIRQDFVANVSHELKTPIASIQGYSETLLSGALDDPAHAKDFIKIIHNESGRLAQLVDDLLNLAKIESGKLNMNLKPVRLLPIIDKVIASMALQAEKKALTLTKTIPEQCPEILADTTRITQVLFNLIDNAIKYTPENGNIQILIKEQTQTLEIEIADNGIGIPEKDIPRLFERFYRVDKGRSRELGGTGLGLSIVKHIVKAHNGTITINSTLGQGSTFTITLPKSH